MHILFLSLFLLGRLTSPSPSPGAQITVEIRNAPVSYHFGEQVHFQASLSAHMPIQEVHLFIQPEGQTTRLEPVTLNQRGEVSFINNSRDIHNAVQSQSLLPPAITLHLSWRKARYSRPKGGNSL